MVSLNESGATASRVLVSHYDREVESEEMGRLSGLKDLVGNLGYLGLRTTLRVVNLGVRVLDVCFTIPAVGFGIKEKLSLSQKVQLAGSSFIRLTSPIVQVPLVVFGSLGKVVTCGSLQQKSVVLLKLAHKPDNYFDQWEREIKGQSNDVINADRYGNVTYSQMNRERLGSFDSVLSDASFSDVSEERSDSFGSVLSDASSHTRLSGKDFLVPQIEAYREGLSPEELARFNEELEGAYNPQLVMELAIHSRMTLEEDVTCANVPSFLSFKQMEVLQDKFRSLTEKEQAVFKLPMQQLTAVLEANDKGQESSISDKGRKLWRLFRETASEASQGNSAFYRVLAQTVEELFPEQSGCVR